MMGEAGFSGTVRAARPSSFLAAQRSEAPGL
jgi:hypothetical protein